MTARPPLSRAARHAIRAVTRYAPFTAHFTFVEAADGVHCAMEAQANQFEIFEAAVVMLHAAIGGLERAAVAGRDVADQLVSLRAARAAFNAAARRKREITRDDTHPVEEE